MFVRSPLPKQALLAIFSLAFLASCIHKKYETPITKKTQQPDKVLFDQAIKDIEHGRYEVARISLQTLMNTYESSEFMAKAKLAVADSWYREGGANGLAQAEAEYKDFELFYPQMEEAAEAQNRVCQIHYKQIEKSDRDWSQALRAEDECRQLLIQYPNSKFAPATAQLVRNIQESLAEHEFVVGTFYWKREMNPAAANRLNALVDQYPLYSKAGEALYEAGDAYSKMGPRFRKTAGEMFGRIARDYPLSARADDAKKRLQEMELPIPPVNQAAYEHEKYEQANYKKPGMMTRSMSWVRTGPDVSHAAKSGAPTMTGPKVTIPASIPAAANTETATNLGSNGGTTDVTVTPSSSGALEKNPDARSTTPAAALTSTDQNTQQALPTNRDKDLKKLRDQQAKKQQKLDKKKKKQDQQNADQSQQSPSGTPAASTPVSSKPPTPPNPSPEP
jgi:outer membrane protein assembly factor BamD